MDYIKLIELTEVITKGTTPTSVGFNFEEEGDVNFVKVESFDRDGNIKLNKIAKISSDCNNALSRSQLKENDILFSIAGALGRVAIVSEDILPANTNQALAIIRLLEKNPITINFLKYYFQSDSILQQVNGFKGGVAQQNLSLSQIKEFNIPNIPLEEQKTIVAKLDQAFAAIDQAKANIEKNIANAKELFQSKLNQIFSQKGEGWEEKKLSDVSNIINGFAFSSKDFKNTNPVKSIKITNVGVNNFVFDNENNLPLSCLERNKSVCIHQGDIVIALTRTIISSGLKVAIVPQEYNLSLLNQRVAAIREGNSLKNSYLYYFLTSKIAKDYVLDHVNTLMQPNLSINDLKKFPVNFPKLKTQQQIVTQLDQLQEQSNLLVTKYQQKQANLEELKKSILQKAFKGELSTAAIEKV